MRKMSDSLTAKLLVGGLLISGSVGYGETIPVKTMPTDITELNLVDRNKTLYRDKEYENHIINSEKLDRSTFAAGDKNLILKNVTINAKKEAVTLENGNLITRKNTVLNTLENKNIIAGSDKKEHIILDESVLNGNISLKAGDDFVIVENNTKINGELNGGEGNDTLKLADVNLKNKISSFENIEVSKDVTLGKTAKIEGNISIVNNSRLNLSIDKNKRDSENRVIDHAFYGTDGSILSGNLNILSDGLGKDEIIAMSDETRKFKIGKDVNLTIDSIIKSADKKSNGDISISMKEDLSQILSSNSEKTFDRSTAEVPNEVLKEVINIQLGKESNSEIEKIELEYLRKLDGDVVHFKKEGLKPEEEANRGIDNITGLEYAVNLEWVDLSENTIDDLSPIKNASKIKWLELDRNNIANLEPLSNLKELEHLNIYNNAGITNLTPISQLKTLKWIDMHHCSRGKDPLNVEVLASLENLEYLSIETNLVEDISFVKSLKKLSTFSCNNTFVTDVESVQDLAAASWVDWSGEKFFNMYSQRLTAPVIVDIKNDETVYRFKSPVKNIDRYVKTVEESVLEMEGRVVHAPALEILSSDEKNIEVSYDHTTDEIILKIAKNQTNEDRKVDAEVMLDYGMYSLRIVFDIYQGESGEREKLEMSNIEVLDGSVDTKLAINSSDEKQGLNADEVSKAAANVPEKTKEVDLFSQMSSNEYENLNKLYKSILGNDENIEALSPTVANIGVDKDSSEAKEELISLLTDIYKNNPYGYAGTIARKNMELFRGQINDNNLEKSEKTVDGGYIYNDLELQSENIIGTEIDVNNHTNGGFGKIEYGISDKVSAGVIFGGIKNSGDINNSSLKSTGLYTGLYSKFNLNNLSLKAGIGYQYEDYDASRTSSNKFQGESYNSKFSENSIDAYIGASYKYMLGDLCIEPVSELSFTGISQNSISEDKKPLSMDVEKKDLGYIDAEIGMKLGKKFIVGNSSLLLNCGVFYDYSFDEDKYLTGRMKDGSSFDILVPEKEDGLKLTLETSLEIKDVIYTLEGGYLKGDNHKNTYGKASVSIIL